jgi:2-hydroxychromene-2-carboxylate isomerase
MPPFAPPEGWPVQSWSLAPLRAALVADELGRQREFARAAFRKAFVESRSLADLENVLGAAGDAGLDADQIADGIERREIKDRLRENTDEALARGVTGIPTVVVGDDVFWGDDRLDEAAAAAGRTPTG